RAVSGISCGRVPFPVKKTLPRTTETAERIAVLEPDEALLSSILSALHEIVPEAVVDVAHDVDEAHRIASTDPVRLFVVDVDMLSDSNPDLLRDLRARHPKARTILLRTGGTASSSENSEGM